MTAPVLEKPRILTPEEFLAMEDAVAYEMCDDGTLVERPMSQESSEVGALLFLALGAYVRANRFGTAFGPDLGLQIFPGRPRRIPRADVVFISTARRNSQVDRRRGPLTVAPELAVEVVSTWDSAEDLDVKVSEYLEAGVLLVWVLYPETRHAMVFRADGSIERVRADGFLRGEDVLPGFEQPLQELFPPSEIPAPESTSAAEQPS